MTGFIRATRKRLRARMAIIGPPGSGKTYSALAIASGLGRSIGVIDSEHETATLYSDDFNFSTLALSPPFSPRKYIEAIKAAEDAALDVLIIDSLSHAWAGPGGILEMVDEIKEAGGRGSRALSPWGKATPEQNALINAMLSARCHLIVTLRSKVVYVQEEVGGKVNITKKGLQPIQREGVEFEFDIVGDMEGGVLRVTKSRCKELTDARIDKPDARLGEQILDWLTRGADGPSLAEREAIADEKLSAYAKILGPEKCLAVCGKPRRSMTVEEKERAVERLAAEPRETPVSPASSEVTHE